MRPTHYHTPASLITSYPQYYPSMATATLPASFSATLSAATPRYLSKTLTLASNSRSPRRCSLLHSPSPCPPLAASPSRRWRLLASPEVATAPEEPEVEAAPAAVPEPVEAQLAEAAAAGAAKGEQIFAVVMVGSRQYIVMPGRYIYTQRLKGANVNDQIILNKVLLVATRDKSYIGMPVVTNAAVHAVVEEQGRDDKVIVFKYKKKKKYKRTIGHRQPNTRLRITGISGYEDYPADTMPEAIPT